MAVYAPHPEEQAHDPRARAEGVAAVAQLSEGHLVELVQAQKKEADEHTEELRNRWAVWLDLWESRVDLSGKEDWQTQIWIPKPFAAVEQASALIQRAMVDSPEFWGMTAEDEYERKLADKLWTPLHRRTLDENHFAQKFTDIAKIGFILGVAGYLKFRVQSTQVPTLAGLTFDPQTGALVQQMAGQMRTFLAVDVVDPCRIYRDPDSRPRENYSGTYLYHAEWKSRTYLRAMQAAGWDAEKVESVLGGGDGRQHTLAGGSAATRIDLSQGEKLASHRHKFRKMYLVNEGWLDVLNEHGDVVLPDALMIESNDKILCGPVPNPLWASDLATGRRKWPFIASAPIAHPFRFEGRGVIEQDADLSSLYSHTFMLWADGLNWSVNPPTEVHQDALVDWDDMSHYPGKLWVKKVATQALLPAQTGRMDIGAVLNALQYIDQIRQNVNFVTDFAVGLPGSRSDITKGEVEIKTAQSLAIFEGMGRNLELGGREAVELVHDLSVQFLMANPQEPTLARILGPRNAQIMASAPLQERIEMVQGNFDFYFTGVSSALKKADQLARVNQVAALITQSPYREQLLMTQPGLFLTLLKEVVNLLGLGDQIEVQELPPMGPPGMAPPGPGGAPGGGGLLDQSADAVVAELLAQSRQGPPQGSDAYASQPEAAGMGPGG